MPDASQFFATILPTFLVTTLKPDSVEHVDAQTGERAPGKAKERLTTGGHLERNKEDYFGETSTPRGAADAILTTAALYHEGEIGFDDAVTAYLQPEICRFYCVIYVNIQK